MTALNKIKAWNSTRRGWPTLGAVLGLVGAAWLSAVHSGSAENNRRDHRYSPITSIGNSTGPAASERGGSNQSRGRHPLDDALEFVQPTILALKNVKDYTAVFTKTELVHGRLLTRKMDMKFRQNPFSVYFHGHSKRKAGREVIFVAGQNEGKLIVHEVGLKSIVGTMHLNPEDPKVMDTNRYPITEVGISKIIESAIEIWKNEKSHLDSANIQVRIVESVQVGAMECDAVEVAHQQQQPGLTYQVGRVYVDRHSRLPVQAELYGWPATPGEDPPLLEQYTYTDLKTNVGLNAADFDPSNREYCFDVSQRD